MTPLPTTPQRGHFVTTTGSDAQFTADCLSDGMTGQYRVRAINPADGVFAAPAVLIRDGYWAIPDVPGLRLETFDSVVEVLRAISVIRVQPHGCPAPVRVTPHPERQGLYAVDGTPTRLWRRRSVSHWRWTLGTDAEAGGLWTESLYAAVAAALGLPRPAPPPYTHCRIDPWYAPQHEAGFTAAQTLPIYVGALGDWDAATETMRRRANATELDPPRLWEYRILTLGSTDTVVGGPHIAGRPGC